MATFKEDTAGELTSDILHGAGNEKGRLFPNEQQRVRFQPPTLQNPTPHVAQSECGEDDDGTQYADGRVSAAQALAALRNEVSNTLLPRLPSLDAVYWKEHSSSGFLPLRLYVSDRFGVTAKYFAGRHHLWAYFDEPKDNKDQAPPMGLRAFQQSAVASSESYTSSIPLDC